MTSLYSLSMVWLQSIRQTINFNSNNIICGDITGKEDVLCNQFDLLIYSFDFIHSIQYDNNRISKE